MLNPDQFAELMGFPTATVTATLVPSVKPIPTVVPTPPEWQCAEKAGHTTLWVMFGIMLASTIVFAGLSHRVPVSRRLYHFLTTLTTLVAALSYFAMASGGGKSFHCDHVTDGHRHVPDTHHVLCREVYWARYADWVLTTPLLLAELCLLAGVDGAHTIMALLADVVMVLAGLFAAFGREETAQKWGWFAIACVAYVAVVWHVAAPGARSVKAKGPQVKRLFTGLGGFALLLWALYPIVWGVGDGARQLTVDKEIIAYAVLDTLAKPVFGLWLLISHRRTPEMNVELGGYWTHGAASEGTIRIGDDGAIAA